MSSEQHISFLVQEIRQLGVLLGRQNDLLHAILEAQKRIEQEIIRAGLV